MLCIELETCRGWCFFNFILELCDYALSNQLEEDKKFEIEEEGSIRWSGSKRGNWRLHPTELLNRADEMELETLWEMRTFWRAGLVRRWTNFKFFLRWGGEKILENMWISESVVANSNSGEDDFLKFLWEVINFSDVCCLLIILFSMRNLFSSKI